MDDNNHVQVGDILKINLKKTSFEIDFDCDNLPRKFKCQVAKIKTSKIVKYDSQHIYKLHLIDSNVFIKTRLMNLYWRKVSNAPENIIETKRLKHQLPNHKYILAPMVGASELPFRILCRKYGAQLAYTPMMNSERFAIDAEYRQQEFQTNLLDHPIVAHFSGNHPMTMLTACKHIEYQADAIDLNLGCPQRVAHAGHFGSYLLDEIDRSLILSIVNTLSTQLSIPIFVKIRLLDTLEETTRLCFQLAEAGASLIAIHGRYRVNLVARTGPGARDGPAHLDQIKTIKESFIHSNYAHVAIISNGNVISWNDVIQNLEYTAADGIMSAEGLLDDPALFFPVTTLLSSIHDHNHSHNSIMVSDNNTFVYDTKNGNNIDDIIVCQNSNTKKKQKTSSDGVNTDKGTQLIHQKKPTPLQLAMEYMTLILQYPATLKTIIFHIRRMCKDLLIKYESLDDVLNATSIENINTILTAISTYESTGQYIPDIHKKQQNKEALERKKLQENRRKEYEKRMIRKAKRENKALDYYLHIGAKLPSTQELDELRALTYEECFGIWKKEHSQHCFAYHIHHYPGMKKCDRDRTCAFLHMDPVYNIQQQEENDIYG